MLATQAAPTSVTAFRGLALWSAWDPAARTYQLVGSRDGGPPFVLPVPPRTVPFDADLGPDGRGRPVAVYSRCLREAPWRGEYRTIQVSLPEYARGRECDVWRYSFAREAEQRVRGASRDGVSEYLPSVWRNRLVFGRIDSRLPRFRGVQPRLAVLRLDGGRRLRLLRGGRTGFYDSPRPRTNSTVGGPGLSRVDIHGKRIAWTWESLADACASNDPAGKDDPTITELFLERLGRSRQRLRRGCSDDPINFMQSPSFAAGRLSWVTAAQPNVAPGAARSTK